MMTDENDDYEKQLLAAMENPLTQHLKNYLTGTLMAFKTKGGTSEHALFAISMAMASTYPEAGEEEKSTVH